MPEIDSKELRRKEYFEEEPQDKLIDEKIEWFEDWNYPKKQ
jgi:hypothetical protein